MRVNSIALCFALAAAATLASPASPGTSPLAVGSAAPPLELTAADGSRRSLVAGDGPKVLIFYRGLW